MADILFAQAEIGMMSKMGGGTSINLSSIRPRGSAITDNGKTSGAVHFARLFEEVTNVTSQGNQRRGRVAPYLDMSHGDIMEFLDVATDGNIIQHVTTGITVRDDFMEDVRNGDNDKRKKWAKMLKTRGEIGFPYVVYLDNMERNKPQVYKDKSMEIKASNLCS
jgi:ribonucleoside-diphosphate reductase alpha chain